jgi:hypothetical protein
MEGLQTNNSMERYEAENNIRSEFTSPMDSHCNIVGLVSEVAEW